VDSIGLRETIETLRSEQLSSTAEATDQPVPFPVGSVQLEFQVGVIRDARADGKVRFWILEPGARGSYQDQSVWKVRVNFQPPVGLEGRPVKANRRSPSRP